MVRGRPLASYFDYVYFASDDEHRALLNIGGIGNVSVIPQACSPDEVFAFDTGPGNMVIDSVVKRLYNEPFDEGGRRASEGAVHQGLLDVLLADTYYELEPPKTTGRELYNTTYVDGLFEKAAQLNVNQPEDLVTTATTLTVETIARSCESFILPRVKIDRMIVSGGGVHNQWMMNQLAQRLPSMEVLSASELGLNADAKEAMFFALFAHETLNGMPSNIPSATGASRPAILGKICLP